MKPACIYMYCCEEWKNAIFRIRFIIVFFRFPSKFHVRCTIFKRDKGNLYFNHTLMYIYGYRKCNRYTSNTPSTVSEWNELQWPSDAIWRQGTGSTLARVMACCFMALIHCLSWLIISTVQWHASEENFIKFVPILLLSDYYKSTGHRVQIDFNHYHTI